MSKTTAKPSHADALPGKPIAALDEPEAATELARLGRANGEFRAKI